MLSLWLLMTIGWFTTMFYVSNKAVPIHWIIAVISCASTFEHLINTVRYMLMNTENSDSTALFLLAVLA